MISNKVPHLSIPQNTATPGIPMSKSMTVINKNPHFNSYNPPKTTPIQIGNHSNSHINSASHNITSRNTSKLQQLKHNIWPSSLPSSALPTSTNSNQQESQTSNSSSNNFISTLFGSFRSGSSVSTNTKLDKKVKISFCH